MYENLIQDEYGRRLTGMSSRPNIRMFVITIMLSRCNNLLTRGLLILKPPEHLRFIARCLAGLVTEAFLHFDWGLAENLARYGQATPPLYTLEHVTCPVVLAWAENDLLADPQVRNRPAGETTDRQTE